MRRLRNWLALLGLIALPITYALVTGWNPLPELGNALHAGLDREQALADPAPTWTARTPDTATWAAPAGGAVIIGSRGTVESRDGRSGDVIWSSAADYGAVAGGSGGVASVVVVGTRGHGYQVRDPGSGTVRWEATDAVGVWTFADMIIQIGCAESFACTLTARVPATGAVRWRSAFDGNGRTLSGANHPLPTLRPLGQPIAGAPGKAPPLLGLPVDRRITVFATSDGRRLHSYQQNQTTRIVLAGRVALVSTALYRGGNCRFSVQARDPDGDRPVWRKDGYDLRTSAGLGCEQRSDPLGGAGMVAAIGPDNRDVLLDLATGSAVFQAPRDASIVAVGAGVVVVRAGDKKSLSGYRPGGGSAGWTLGVSSQARAQTLPGQVVVTDPAGEGRLAVLIPDTGQPLVRVTSQATVLGTGPDGLVISIGRSIGLLTVGSA